MGTVQWLLLGHTTSGYSCELFFLLQKLYSVMYKMCFVSVDPLHALTVALLPPLCVFPILP